MSSGNLESAVGVNGDDAQSPGKDTEKNNTLIEAGSSNKALADNRNPAKDEDERSAENIPAENKDGKKQDTAETLSKISQKTAEEQHASFQHHSNSFPYGAYQQATPPPPSPTVPPGSGYDVQAMLFQQQAAFAQQEAAATASPFTRQYSSGVPPLPPLTPTQSTGNNATNGAASNNIPASPLFTAPSPVAYPGNPLTRLDSPAIARMAESSMASPLSPLPYLTSQALPSSPVIHGYSGIYQGGGYRGANTGYRNPANRDIPADQGGKTWSESLSPTQQQHGFQHEKGSPYLQPHNVPVQYQVGFSSSESNHSSQSFDEILPPSAIGGRDPNQGLYTQNPRPGQSVGVGLGATNTQFVHAQQWGGYYANNRGMPVGSYGQHGSWQMGSSHREGGHYHERHVGPPLGGPGHHLGHQFYAATTPGPPIQTSPSNKGPDGANLFIFHIPNHFTNLDMYNLFCHYGNLLSVRIMVEKDTGRSRGFGFVSYDSPEAAAMAIKELNGFVIGNKRLKVQHKQIRPNEQTGQHSPHSYQQSQPFHVSSAGKRDVQRDIRTTDAGASGVERVGSAQIPQWYSTPAPPDLSSESSKAPAAPPFTSLEVPSAVGDTFVHPGKEAGQNVHIDSVADATDQPLGRGQEIPSKDGVVSPKENANGGATASQMARPPFPGADAGNVPGSSETPLGHLESIRNALPDVSK